MIKKEKCIKGDLWLYFFFMFLIIIGLFHVLFYLKGKCYDQRTLTM